MENMNNKTIEIPIEELLESLKKGYIEYKDCLENTSNDIEIAYTKSFCATIEQILISYSDITHAQIMAIKRPILKRISVIDKKDINLDIDYEIPTIFRLGKNAKLHI